MRFLNLVKAAEGAGPPPQALIDAITTFADEATRAGVLVSTAGLLPSAMGARLRLSGGRLHVTDGPFAETKELVGGYAVLDVRSRDEAIEWTSRFMQLHEAHWPGWEGESELRQMFESPGARHDDR